MTHAALWSLERRAADGDATAAYEAGCARHDGEPAELRSLHRSIRWLRQAADGGVAPAARRLGYIHTVDLRDWVGGFAWYRRAAEAGDVKAAYSLGFTYSDPEHRRAYENRAEALRWLKVADEGGEGAAGVQRGLVLLSSPSTVEERFEGAAILSRAATGRFGTACDMLRHRLELGVLPKLSVHAWVDPEAPEFPLELPAIRFHPDRTDDALDAILKAHGAPGDVYYERAMRWLATTAPHRPGPDSQAFCAARLLLTSADRAGVREAVPWRAWLAVAEPGLPRLAEFHSSVVRSVEFGMPGAAAARDWLKRWGRWDVSCAEGSGASRREPSLP